MVWKQVEGSESATLSREIKRGIWAVCLQIREFHGVPGNSSENRRFGAKPSYNISGQIPADDFNGTERLDQCPRDFERPCAEHTETWHSKISPPICAHG